MTWLRSYYLGTERRWKNGCKSHFLKRLAYNNHSAWPQTHWRILRSSPRTVLMSSWQSDSRSGHPLHLTPPGPQPQLHGLCGLVGRVVVTGRVVRVVLAVVLRVVFRVVFCVVLGVVLRVVVPFVVVAFFVVVVDAARNAKQNPNVPIYLRPILRHGSKVFMC